MSPSRGEARRGEARRGWAGRGMAGPGKARQGRAWRGAAWQLPPTRGHPRRWIEGGLRGTDALVSIACR